MQKCKNCKNYAKPGRTSAVCLTGGFFPEQTERFTGTDRMIWATVMMNNSCERFCQRTGE